MKTLWNYNDIVNISKDKKLGNTYTHPYISNSIILQLVDNNKIYNKILEPCVGTGSFYNSIIENLKTKKIKCYDIDQNSISLINERKEDEFYVEDFLLSNNNDKYDLIITNPPYVSYNNITSDKFNNKQNYLNAIKNNIDFATLGITKNEIDLRSDLYIYFFLKSLSLLEDNGKLIFLCSDKWLDTNYGKVLKKILLKNFKLETIVTSNYYPFFKDDTNAIVTVISKRIDNEKSPLKVYSIIEPKFELKNEFNFSFEELSDVFNCNNLNLNNKNKLLFYQKEYNFTTQTIKSNKEKFIELGTLVEIITSNITFKDLIKTNKILEKENISNTDFQKEEDNIVIFYQDQARHNKPINYKQIINKEDLSYYINLKNINNKHINPKGIYMSSMVDRIPLVYYANFKSIGVSKYYYINPKNDVLNDKILLILMNNIFTIQSIETFIKDGTKKTHRTNENGFAKEISKTSLEKILVPNILLLSNKEIDILLKHLDKYSELQINSIENAFENNDYLSLQKDLIKFLNIKVNFNELVNNVKQIYLKRMRNLEKLNMKLNLEDEQND